MAILVERGFTSLSLLALLPPHQIMYRGVLPLLWLSTNTVVTRVERGFTSLSLLALLPPHQIRYREVLLLLWYLNRHNGDPGGAGLHLPSLFSPSSLCIRSDIEEYRRSNGISTNTVAILVERGFTSLFLLDLPPPHQIRYRGVPPLL